MKNILRKTVAAMLVASVIVISAPGNLAWAEDDDDAPTETVATSISISPVSKVLHLQPSTTYEDSFKVTNNGSDDMRFEVYASPYSYTYSEESDEYQLGFSKENNYTQITRWITFKNTEGTYEASPRFIAHPGESVEIGYRISTPDSMPAGGQYAVLFARTLSSASGAGGIKTEASPGLVVYGRSDGETVVESEISGLAIGQTYRVGEEYRNLINAYGKVKNSGNVDFMASGKLTVKSIFGRILYETPANEARISVIPDTELAISDVWEETPYFGVFETTWTVSATQDGETISQLILILPAPVIVIAILLLTIVIVWITIMVRKRRERRSRFMI